MNLVIDGTVDRVRRGRPRPLLALFLATLVAIAASGCREDPPAPDRPAWSDGVIASLRRIAVQDEGRVKPFSTWAKFELLKANHKSSCLTTTDYKISPMVWALDALFHPEVAREYLCFRIDTKEVLTEIGLEFERSKKKMSDSYSYAELAPGRDRLMQRAAHIRMKIEQRELALRDLSRIEQDIFALATNVADFEALTKYMDFARSDMRVDQDPALVELFDGREAAPFSDVVAQLPTLGRALASEDTEGLGAAGDGIRKLADVVAAVSSPTREPALLPPAEPDELRWLSPYEVARSAFSGNAPSAAHIEALRRLETLARLPTGDASFPGQVSALEEHLVGRASARGEYDKIDLEVFFYRLDPFTYAMAFYLLAFVLIAVRWFTKGNKWLLRGVWTVLACALAFHTAGIVIRSIIRDRPPVKTLYETVVFISAFTVLSCMVLERLNPRRIALGLAPVVGALGLFMAFGYEELDRKDTMPQLVAVLDTNFWLATHVVCITMGYGAGLLTGALGHVYVLGKAFGLKSKDTSFYTDLGRMVYGAVCFTLLFSVIGTILGGIWANESWGRFWGWDPKENGALLIVIWQLVILHARLGGYVKPFGTAMMAVFGTAIVAFSWWGVNNLGIGLHSYGFTQGIRDNLFRFYAFEFFVLMTGFVWWLIKRVEARATPPGA
jgi:ABC-type transport system involved in cytochrome c biogenesis permease subunit